MSINIQKRRGSISDISDDYDNDEDNQQPRIKKNENNEEQQQQEGGDVQVENKKLKKKINVFRFKPEDLKGNDGLYRLYQKFHKSGIRKYPQDQGFDETHELNKLMNYCKEWHFSFMPKYEFTHFVQKCQNFGLKGSKGNGTMIRSYLQQMREAHKGKIEWRSLKQEQDLADENPELADAAEFQKNENDLNIFNNGNNNEYIQKNKFQQNSATKTNYEFNIKRIQNVQLVKKQSFQNQSDKKSEITQLNNLNNYPQQQIMNIKPILFQQTKQNNQSMQVENNGNLINNSNQKNQKNNHTFQEEEQYEEDLNEEFEIQNQIAMEMGVDEEELLRLEKEFEENQIEEPEQEDEYLQYMENEIKIVKKNSVSKID